MYLVLDIGGTNTRVAVSKDGKNFDIIKIVSTPKNFHEGMDVIKNIFFSLAFKKKISAVACGIAGSLDKNKSLLVDSPNLLQWVKQPIKKELEKIFEAPVFLENDAALAGLGEAIFGNGKGKDIVAYLTISTGVGGVRINHGKIDDNVSGFEPGHQIIDADSSLCVNCEKPGRLEDYISGAALEKRYQKKPSEITDTKIWDDSAKFLAYGLNDTIVYWSPDIIILGGAVMNIIPMDRVIFYLKKSFQRSFEIPEVKEAALGDESGLYGGLAFLNQIFN